MNKNLRMAMIFVLAGAAAYCFYKVYASYRKPNKDINAILDSAFGSFEDLYACETMEQMAEYADHVCVQNTPDEEFQERQLKGMEGVDLGRQAFQMMNPTSLGNIAYSCVHAPPPHNQRWRAIFREIKERNNLPIKFEI